MLIPTIKSVKNNKICFKRNNSAIFCYFHIILALLLMVIIIHVHMYKYNMYDFTNIKFAC